MFGEFLAERVAVDAQAGRGLELHAAAGGEHLADQFAFDAADDPFEEVGVIFGRRGQPLFNEFAGQAVEIATPTWHDRADRFPADVRGQTGEGLAITSKTLDTSATETTFDAIDTGDYVHSLD